MPPDPIQLYLDEDTLSRSLISALRSRGVDVLTAHEADMGGRSDVAHLEFAASTSRTVLTCNYASRLRRQVTIRLGDDVIA
jgi:hypothetical protein